MFSAYFSRVFSFSLRWFYAVLAYCSSANVSLEIIRDDSQRLLQPKYTGDTMGDSANPLHTFQHFKSISEQKTKKWQVLSDQGWAIAPHSSSSQTSSLCASVALYPTAPHTTFQETIQILVQFFCTGFFLVVSLNKISVCIIPLAGWNCRTEQYVPLAYVWYSCFDFTLRCSHQWSTWDIT